MKVWTIVCLGLAVLMFGCQSESMKSTGFLSDYSKLQRETDTSLKYIDQKAAASYTSFIVEPVQVKFYSDTQAKEKLTPIQIRELTTYMQAKIIEAIKGAGLKVVYKPESGVARARVALTSMQKSDMINILPQASLMQAGVGGATMEAELVDSMTGKQVAAVMQSGKGSRIPFSNLGDMTAAKSVIDEWCQNFQKKLEAMHSK
jgi:hypothetical protein